MIRVGLVGFGLAGKVFHAPVISAVPGLELVAVVERHSRDSAAAYPSVTIYPSLTAMLAEASLELVVIATPTPSHSPLAIEALTAGCHVVVDKPFAATSAEIAEMMACSKTRGGHLFPFHNRRWDSDFRTLRQLLDEHRLGRIVSCESAFDRWRPAPKLGVWREDGSFAGGTLLDLGTHLVDQAIELFGKPLGVSAEVAQERDGSRAPDSFDIRLRYPALTATVAGNCLAAIPRPRFRVRGSEGNFVKYGLDSQEDRLRLSGRIVEPGWGEEPESTWGTLAVEQDGELTTTPVPSLRGDYRDYYRAVRDAILEDTPPPVEAIDAWRGLRILEWAVQSSVEYREIPCDWSAEPKP
jgi:scyllo-inositol 2-dehydrogenase (NADP+)